MTRPLTTSFLLLVAIMLQAAPVTKDKAKEAATRFLQQKDGAPLSRSREMTPVNLTEADLPSDGEFYVFNVGQREGFVIVSGDDRTDEILGYADNGEILSDNMPENLKAWLQGYADQIKWMQENNITLQPVANARRNAAVKTDINPLLGTTWNQGSPYNNNCPKFVTGNARCVTGCVATAMAQVINYHGQRRGLPNVTKAIEAYNCSTNRGNANDPQYVHVDAIAANQSFDWANMLPYYSGSESDSQKAAVALLMQYCGASVHMDYGVQSHGGSNASDYNVPLALKTYFDYDAETRYVRREDYTIMDWDNLIYSELSSGRPVLYGGQSSGGGHAFVVDGYDGDGFFHVNWGWGSQCDGYFTLSALDPDSNSSIGASSTSDGYNTGQDAVIGAQPSTGSPAEEDNSLLLGSIEGIDNENKTITVKYINWSGQQNNFDYGIGYMSGENIVPIMTGIYNNLPNDTYIQPVITISNLAAGRYKLFPISKASTSSIWKTNVDVERDYVLAEVSGENITLTKNALTPNLAVYDMTFSGLKYVNNTQTVEVTISNIGDEFTGYIYMFASTSSEKGQAVSKKSIAVRNNRRATFNMSFLPEVAGTYTVWICSDKDGNNVIGSRTVTIENKPADTYISDFQIVACSFDKEDLSTLRIDGNAPNQITDVYTNNVVAHITVKNMASTEQTYYFVFLLSRDDGSGYNNVTFGIGTYNYVTMPSGATMNINIDFDTLEYGKRYKIVLQKLVVEGGSLTSQATFDDHIRFRTVSCYPAWNENGVKSNVETTASELVIAEDVVAVDLSGYTFTNVTANSNPNTLYYLSKSQTIPTGLEGMNVIQEKTASNIQLQDGHSFYVPTEFTATNITYTRKFTTSANTTTGGGWSTMVIPFEVSTVKVGEKLLNWFQSDEDSNKDFWLLQFASDETDQVNFSYTNTIHADYPYIIAVPGDTWGEEHKLTGQDIVFSGANVTISNTSKAMLSGDFYTMYGTYTPHTISTGAYVLNSTGTGFALKSNSVTLEPFRAYFMPKYGNGSHSELRIGMTGYQTTGITPQFSTTFTTGDVYSISGMKVGTIDHMQQLKPGIYIVNGKKYVKH